jgi:hypothetical protein
VGKTSFIFLCAGFSAPLGIPTMRNFIDKARQIRSTKPEYTYFNEIIESIRSTALAEKYYLHESDNIEEALSLLEMRDNLDGSNRKERFINFIKDVIETSTPPIPVVDKSDRSIKDWTKIFTPDQTWQGYCSFIASLNHAAFFDFKAAAGRNAIGVKLLDSDVNYSILTFNYDLVLENICIFLNHSFSWPNECLSVSGKLNANKKGIELPRLVKIHGSIDSGNIIPPTVNKGLYGNELPPTWREAYNILVKANEIRIIGYSLPQTDSYLKYLLMASIDRLNDLNQIDWIVRDKEGEVEKRFNEFVRFKNKRFKKADVSNYLGSLFGYTFNQPLNDKAKFDKLELAHEEFMRG